MIAVVSFFFVRLHRDCGTVFFSCFGLLMLNRALDDRWTNIKPLDGPVSASEGVAHSMGLLLSHLRADSRFASLWRKRAVGVSSDFGTLCGMVPTTTRTGHKAWAATPAPLILGPRS